jgi:hypothetical protein
MPEAKLERYDEILARQIADLALARACEEKIAYLTLSAKDARQRVANRRAEVERLRLLCKGLLT